jgi:diaminopimelate epimerase
MKTDLGPALNIYKMQGSGNDFVLVNNQEANIAESEMASWAQAVCRRSFAVGADGCIFLQTDPENPAVDYRWHFFNSDGSRPEMCGNGSRCAAMLAYELGFAPAKHVLGTDAGPVKTEVFPGLGEVKVQLTPAHSLKTNLLLDLDMQGEMQVHFVNTGVPHAVCILENAQETSIQKIGPAVRYHGRFAPEGANTNLVQVVDENNIYLRTYERGVEAETYACGTGAAAAAVVCNNLGFCSDNVSITTSGGERLQILLENGDVFLQGEAKLIYKAELYLQSLKF